MTFPSLFLGFYDSFDFFSLVPPPRFFLHSFVFLFNYFLGHISLFSFSCFPLFCAPFLSMPFSLVPSLAVPSVHPVPLLGLHFLIFAPFDICWFLFSHSYLCYFAPIRFSSSFLSSCFPFPATPASPSLVFTFPLSHFLRLVFQFRLLSLCSNHSSVPCFFFPPSVIWILSPSSCSFWNLRWHIPQLWSSFPFLLYLSCRVKTPTNWSFISFSASFYLVLHFLYGYYGDV